MCGLEFCILISFAVSSLTPHILFVSFDCDPCMELAGQGCKACAAGGCFYCNLDAEPLCISAGSSDWPLDSACFADDFVGDASSCSPVQGVVDTCDFQFDGVCDAGTYCDAGSDWCVALTSTSCFTFYNMKSKIDDDSFIHNTATLTMRFIYVISMLEGSTAIATLA